MCNCPILVDQELDKVPLDVIPEDSPFARLQESIQRGCIFPINFNLEKECREEDEMGVLSHPVSYTITQTTAAILSTFGCGPELTTLKPYQTPPQTIKAGSFR